MLYLWMGERNNPTHLHKLQNKDNENRSRNKRCNMIITGYAERGPCMMIFKFNTENKTIFIKMYLKNDFPLHNDEETSSISHKIDEDFTSKKNLRRYGDYSLGGSEW
jgi:hypothetical protein